MQRKEQLMSCALVLRSQQSQRMQPRSPADGLPKRKRKSKKASEQNPPDHARRSHATSHGSARERRARRPSASGSRRRGECFPFSVCTMPPSSGLAIETASVGDSPAFRDPGRSSSNLKGTPIKKGTSGTRPPGGARRPPARPGSCSWTKRPTRRSSTILPLPAPALGDVAVTPSRTACCEGMWNDQKSTHAVRLSALRGVARHTMLLSAGAYAPALSRAQDGLDPPHRLD